MHFYENVASWTMTIITQESCHSVVEVHENVEAVKLYSKVDVELYIFSLPFSPLPFLFSLHPPLRSGPLNPARRSVDSDVARGLKGGTRKTGLTGDLSRTCQKKIEFGIGGCTISACIEGSLAFFSLFLLDILSRSQFLPHPTPPYCFYANFDKL